MAAHDTRRLQLQPLHRRARAPTTTTIFRHSPQRPAGSVGLVVEKIRLPGDVAPKAAEDAYAIQDAFVALRSDKLGAMGHPFAAVAWIADHLPARRLPVEPGLLVLAGMIPL